MGDIGRDRFASLGHGRFVLAHRMYRYN